MGKILAGYRGEFDFWTEVRVGHKSDIYVPSEKSDFTARLEELGFDVEVKIEDVTALIKQQEIDRANNPGEVFNSWGFAFDKYHTYDEIVGFLDNTTIEYSYTELETIGQSYEGRDMKVLKICDGACDDSRPTIFFQCGETNFFFLLLTFR